MRSHFCFPGWSTSRVGPAWTENGFHFPGPVLETSGMLSGFKYFFFLSVSLGVPFPHPSHTPRKVFLPFPTPMALKVTGVSIVEHTGKKNHSLKLGASFDKEHRVWLSGFTGTGHSCGWSFTREWPLIVLDLSLDPRETLAWHCRVFVLQAPSLGLPLCWGFLQTCPGSALLDNLLLCCSLQTPAINFWVCLGVAVA